MSAAALHPTGDHADGPIRRSTLTAEELAERWGITPRTILAMATAGRIPHLKVGAGTRKFKCLFPVASIERFELEQAEASVVRPEPAADPVQPLRRRRNRAGQGSSKPATTKRKGPARPVEGVA